MSFRRINLFAAVAGIALLAACKDQGPGSLSDPAAVTSELAAMDSAFTGIAFQSYAELAPMITPTAGGALARAAIIVEGSTPELPEPAYLRGTRRADAWRKLVPQVASLTSGPIIPDPVLGQTFEWDVSTDAYVATSRTGAPANGVRFVLYAINSITHQPIEPVVEVGSVDLMDESVGNTLRLHIQVKGTGGTPTYLDYTATITSTSANFTATVNGNITNGASALALKTLTFNLSFQVSSNAVTANASFDLNNPSVSVDVYERLTASETGIRVSVDFRFSRPGEVVRVAGTLSIATVGDLFAIEGDMVVTVNGGVFARLHTNGEAAQWTKHDGSPLTAAELEALENLFQAMTNFFDFLDDLLDPVDELVA
jgi:hypothetical protein